MNDVVDLIKKIQKSERLAKKKGNEIARSDLGNISGGGFSYHRVDASSTVIAAGDNSKAANSSSISVRGI